MKNLYALDKNKQLCHIENVDKSKNKDFTCCNCGETLIARKGNINAHHFAHKSQLNCSFESYLHKLGKLKFFKTYSSCLQHNEPFYLQYKTKRTCVSCENLNHIINKTCELDEKFELYDLTSRFDQIYLEKGHEGYIADILLKSSEHEDVLFIEIAVTHKCELEKVDSGIRIIEVNISSEKDLNFLSTKSFKLENKNLDFYNFITHHHRRNYHKNIDCRMPFEIFSVLQNGKAVKRDTKMYGIIDDLKNREFLHYQILESDNDNDYFINAQNYTGLIKEVSQKGIKVKNCYACRFSAKNNSHYREYSLFCKKLRSEIPNSNFGSECDKFWRIA